MDRKLEAFEDILTPRRKELSNFMWVSRQLKTVVPFQHNVKTRPQQHKVEVLNSRKMQEIIFKLSQMSNVSTAELEEQTKFILDEIGYDKKLKVIRWLGLFLAKICPKVCAGIHVNKDSLFQFKSQMGDTPVMYVPSHRSYADFILMSYMCFHYDIEIPAIAAGMDFHGMMGMGQLLRCTGAFFMRRSYNDDALYWDTFRQYVYQLVVNGDTGIEFFIEGTRSRSGKSLPPKFGLLSMILKAFFNGEVPDILFVPINISYDRVMEEKLFAFELLGVPKPKESTSAFFKSLRLIKEKYGDIYINFGKPISAHSFFGDRIDRSVHGIKPMHAQPITESERKITSVLAQEIVTNQQKLCIVTTFNLIAVILTNNLLNKEPILSVAMLMDEVVWMKLVLETLGALTNFTSKGQNLFDALDVHKHLVKIGEEGAYLVENNIVLDNYNPARLKGHLLSERTMTKAVPFVMLQLYVNPTMHYFIVPSILTIILKSIKEEPDEDKLFEEYSFLRCIFGNEFVLFTNKDKLEFSESLGRLERLRVIRFEKTRICLSENKKLQRLLCNLLEMFVFTYYVVCSVLINVAVDCCSEQKILVICQHQLEDVLNNDEHFVHPYVLNLDTISNCLHSLVDMKALVQNKKNSGFEYQICSDMISQVCSKLYVYIQHMLPVRFHETINCGIQLESKL